MHVHLIYPRLFTFYGGISKVKCSYVSTEQLKNSAQNTGRNLRDPGVGDASGDEQSSSKTGVMCENGEGHLSDTLLKNLKWSVLCFTIFVELIPLWHIILKLTKHNHIRKIQKMLIF